jgi:hypothetical protein
MNNPETIKKVDRVLWAACSIWLMMIICIVGTVIHYLLGG